MVVVSIDQTFLWNFHTKRHANASRLLSLLEAAVKHGKAVCPVHSKELIEEGSKAPPDIRVGIFEYANALSAGLAFRNFAWAVADESLQLVRPTHRPQKLLEGRLDPPKDICGFANEMRDRVEDYEARLNKCAYPPIGFSRNQGRDKIYNAVVNARRDSMCRLVEAILDGKSLEDTGSHEWEFTMDAAHRLRLLNIQDNECEQLITLIRQRKWELTPTMHQHSRLCAQLEFEHLYSTRGVDRNNYFDLTRQAVGLTDANVVLCDKSMSQLTKSTGLNAPPSFSWSTSAEAIQLLEGFIN
jgi:hypothetical protein